MKKEILEAAYGGLLHDIGKFIQRTDEANTLNEIELDRAVYHESDQTYSHLHCGYTSRFLKEVLGLDGEFEAVVSSHHSKEGNALSSILQRADQIASGIDCIDEEKDQDDIYQSGSFIERRMNSVFSEIDFGKASQGALFRLDTLESIRNPVPGLPALELKHAIREYKELYASFLDDLKLADQIEKGIISEKNYNALYAALQKHCSLVPSSSYDRDVSFVSLFDHLKLTSAIAGCLAASEGKEDFYMLEFDISGIQKFIYKVVEGTESKKGIAKALRGRSFFINLVCGYITYAFLHEFHLPQANIIFNTGGGALIMLPGLEHTEETVNRKAEELLSDLHQLFGTDITFVFALEKCNAEELETFKTDKAIRLKGKLEKQKARKFRTLIKNDLYFMETSNSIPCRICGYNLVQKEGNTCPVCRTIEQISDFMVRNEEFFINYSFQSKDVTGGHCLLIGKGSISLSTSKTDGDYVDSINMARTGNVKYRALLVPKKRNVLNFESICETLLPGDETGDRKLAILKMDVDNLGAVFAYGMSSDTRSLSKYQSLSRLMEHFFSIRLEKICRKVSSELNPQINSVTDNGTMFYINYAGGDDLVIFGPAKGILRLAKSIRDEFRSYVLNDNITLSGGIHIQNPKQPIRYGVLKEEEMLEQAKQNEGKNSIGLLDTVLTYPEYDKVLDESEKYQAFIRDGVMSRSLLYQYMKVLDDCEEFDTYLSKVPRLLYSMIRNINKEENLNEVKQMILSAKDYPALRMTVLAMKLAIMETRENDG